MRTNLTYEELESFFKWVVAFGITDIKQFPLEYDKNACGYEFKLNSTDNIYPPTKIAEIYIKGTDNLRGINKV